MINENERRKTIENELTSETRCTFEEYRQDMFKDGWKTGVKDGIDVAIDAIAMFIKYGLILAAVLGFFAIVLSYFVTVDLSNIAIIVFIIYFIIAPKKMVYKALAFRNWEID